MIREI